MQRRQLCFRHEALPLALVAELVVDEEVEALHEFEAVLFVFEEVVLANEVADGAMLPILIILSQEL